MGLKACDRHASGVFVYSGDVCTYCTLQRVLVQTESRLCDRIAELEAEVKVKQAQLEKAIALVDVQGLLEKADALQNSLQYAKLLEAMVAQLERSNPSEVK